MRRTLLIIAAILVILWLIGLAFKVIESGTCFRNEVFAGTAKAT